MSAVYFAGVMVRLMLTLTPIVCVLASISVSHVLDGLMSNNSNDEGIHIHCTLVHVSLSLSLSLCIVYLL